MVIKLRISGSWPLESELLIELIVTQQRVNTKLTVMIIASVLELEELK